jgi:rhamnogalacturonyl hydrolase YesR
MLFSGLVCAVLAAAPAAAAPQAKSYLKVIADSYIRRGVPDGFGYGEATLYSGIEATYSLTKNETILSWYRKQIDEGVITDDGEIIDWDLDFYSLDEYRIGNNLLYWYQKTGEAKYKTALSTIRQQLDRHTRNPRGGFWHRDPNYPNQMWLDGIFMADTFYTRWTKEFDSDNTTAWDDIILQYDLIEEHCRNHTTNLLVHGYDEGRAAVWADPITGAAPLVWGRAVGWYFMSLAEVIPVFPTSHPGHARLVEYFVTLAEGLKQADERDDGWWLIMSEPYPGKQGNYIESSAHAMFTFGLLNGLRTGLLPKAEYKALAAKAYATLTDRFLTSNADGTVNFIETVQVGSLSSNGTYEVRHSHPFACPDARGC